MQNMNDKTIFGLDSNLAALLFNILAPVCCFRLVISIIANSFVRFYAAQTIVTWAALFVFNLIVGGIGGFMLGAMHLGALSSLVSIALAVLAFAVFIYTGIQGYQGKMFELPVIGGIARSIAGN